MGARLRIACLLAVMLLCGTFVAVAGARSSRRSRNSLAADDDECQRVKAPGSSTKLDSRELAHQLSHRRQESRVLMSATEMAIIESFMKPSDVMLEWGSGFSTLWFSSLVGQYYSIEHDAEWSATVGEQLNGRDNVHYLTAPVAKGHKGWGGGIEEGTAAQFANYVQSVEVFQVPSFDKVLIDGRARVVCAEYVLKFLHKESVVFVHDFTPRSGYHEPIERYYSKVLQTFEGQTLAVFRPTEEALKMAAAGEILTDFESEPV